MSHQKVKLDVLNKKILLELTTNCRLSYRQLGTRLGYSYKTIQKRIMKLFTANVIVEYTINAAPALFGEEDLMLFVYPDKSVKEQTLLNKLGTHPRIYFGHTNLNGPIRVFANFLNTHEFDDIGRHCRRQPGVEKVESHILLRDPGSKCTLTPVDLQILKCLLHNPRMRINEIAKHTRLSTRRVRNTLKKLLPQDGAFPHRVYHMASSHNFGKPTTAFTTHTIFHINSATSNVASCVCKIHHNDATTTRFEIAQWLQHQYPTEYWYSYASASAPVTFHLLTIEHINTLEPLLDHLTHNPHITHVEAFIPLQRKTYSPIYSRTQLETLIHNTTQPP